MQLYLPTHLLTFPCSQCDDLRDRMLRRGGMSKSDEVISRLQKKKQCQREKRGFALIEVRVIIGWKEEGPCNTPALMPKKRDAAVESKNDMRKKRYKLKAAKQAKSDSTKKASLEQKREKQLQLNTLCFRSKP